MKNLKNISLVAILAFLFSLVPAQTQAISLFGSHMEDGKKNFATYKYEAAINEFTEELKDNPENANAHYWIGLSYDKLNDRRNAVRNFKTAVLLDAEYNQKINKAIFKLNPAHIAEIKNTLKEAAKKNSAFKNELNNFYFTNGEKDAVAGNLRDAEQWFSFAIGLNPSQEQKISNTYYELGHYKLALRHNPDNDYARLALGKKRLQTAINDWPHKNTAYYEAVELLGKVRVEQIIPVSQIVPVFEKTYTYADAFDKEDGSIRTFDITKDVEIGDQVEIIGKLLKQDTFTGEELWIWRGKNKSPKWARTKNGYYSKKIKAINVGTGNNGKYFIVSFDGRKDVSVTVKILRQITPQPKLNLLANLH